MLFERIATQNVSLRPRSTPVLLGEQLHSNEYQDTIPRWRRAAGPEHAECASAYK